MYHYAALITCLTGALLWFQAAMVGRGRGKHGVQAPATTGNPEFERLFRVHYNTIENAVWFLPVLWLFAIYWSDRYAGILGAVWLVGRILYTQSYYRDPAARGPGTLISLIAATLLLLGALIRISMALLKG